MPRRGLDGGRDERRARRRRRGRSPFTRDLAPLATRQLRAPDPPRQADRDAASALADALRRVARDMGQAAASLRADLCDGHAPHALGRLRLQRLGGPPFRPARRADREASARGRRNPGVGGARRRRRARVLRVPVRARHEPRRDPHVASGDRDRDRLPVHQALLRAAAGLPRARVLVRHPDGVRGGLRRRTASRLVAARAQRVLGDGVRHRIRDGRPRGRSEARPADVGDLLRAFRRGRGHALLRRLPRRHGCDRPLLARGTALLHRPRRRLDLRAVALLAHPRPGSAIVASARSCTTTGSGWRCSPASRRFRRARPARGRSRCDRPRGGAPGSRIRDSASAGCRRCSRATRAC